MQASQHLNNKECFWPFLSRFYQCEDFFNTEQDHLQESIFYKSFPFFSIWKILKKWWLPWRGLEPPRLAQLILNQSCLPFHHQGVLFFFSGINSIRCFLDVFPLSFLFVLIFLILIFNTFFLKKNGDGGTWTLTIKAINGF